MSISIVDKRTVNRDRTTENRQRFLRRIKATIKEQLPKIIGNRKLADIAKQGGTIRVNRKTISEPSIHHGQGGNIDRVLPGNEEYVEGDLVPKPHGGSGSGSGGTSGDDYEEDFLIDLSREEFLNFFFEDLELPDLLKTELAKLKEYKRENAGFQPDGSPNRLSVQRSYRHALSRKIVVRNSIDNKIMLLEQELKIHEELPLDDPVRFTEDEFAQLRGDLAKLKERREKIPMFEEMDLRYHLSVRREVPVTSATMIMIMDNSGSMGLKEKTIARKFFWLLYSFLDEFYENVDTIFISHTETAVEMDEDEFFNTRIAGGTCVSSALDLAKKIITDRGLAKTNIYVAQVSDGDNIETDNGTCAEILEDDLLPFVRYFAYVQVDSYHDMGDMASNPTMNSLMNDRGLWRSYRLVSERVSKLQIRRVFDEKDIFPVFRELFKKRGNTK